MVSAIAAEGVIDLSDIITWHMSNLETNPLPLFEADERHKAWWADTPEYFACSFDVEAVAVAEELDCMVLSVKTPKENMYIVPFNDEWGLCGFLEGLKDRDPPCAGLYVNGVWVMLNT